MKELLSENNIQLINQAAYFEKEAAQTYEHFSNIAKVKGLFGCSKFFLNESKDEHSHFQKLADFMNDMGELISMPSIAGLSEEIESIDEIFEKAYELELNLLEFYEGLLEELPARCRPIVLEMIEKQVTSVGEYGDLIARLAITEDDILIFDQELGNGL